MSPALQSRARRWRQWLVLAALLLASAGPALAADAVGAVRGPMAFWKTFFARPDAVPAPADNPSTPEKVALGYELFRDTRLSGNMKMSCSTCHVPAQGFTDGRPRGRGNDGRNLRRNTPSLYNLAWSQRLFWDGRAPSLEAQARGPIERPDEMNARLDDIAVRLSRDPAMANKFSRAFPGSGQITPAAILKALAAYERTLITPRTRFDRWIGGETAALDAKEAKGFGLFVGKAACVTCHAGWRFTDDRFHVIGLPGKDPGRGAIAGGVPGWPAFKTPGLREITHTGPYMHDGSLASLAAVIDHYAGGFEPVRNLSNNIVRDLALTADEKAQLIAFLRTLSSTQMAGRR